MNGISVTCWQGEAFKTALFYIMVKPDPDPPDQVKRTESVSHDIVAVSSDIELLPLE